MTLVTLFIVSATIMIGLVSFRSIELIVGRDIISQNTRNTVDKNLYKFFRISHSIGSILKRKIYFELRKFPIMILHIFVNLWASALRITLKMVSLVQGRGNGHAKGSVSEYLKAVEAFKEHLK